MYVSLLIVAKYSCVYVLMFIVSNVSASLIDKIRPYLTLLASFFLLH